MASMDLLSLVSELTHANVELSRQVEFLKKNTADLGQRLAKRCSDLEKENQRLQNDLTSELTYRDWNNLKNEVDDMWQRDDEEAMVKKLNDWIKNSDNPLRYELLLEYIYDMDIPAFRRLQKKAEVKLALLERGRDVARETKIPENTVGYTTDPVPAGRAWRRILKGNRKS